MNNTITVRVLGKSDQFEILMSIPSVVAKQIQEHFVNSEHGEKVSIVCEDKRTIASFSSDSQTFYENVLAAVHELDLLLGRAPLPTWNDRAWSLNKIAC